MRQRPPTFSPRFTPRTALERRLSSTLWSFRSPAWTGFIDFREPGVYFTHWGFGEWSSEGDDERTIRMRNGFDPFFFLVRFDDDLLTFTGVRTNHPQSTPLTGDLLFDYANQELPRPFWR